METAVNLKLFRKRNSLTQEDLAEFLGATKGFISQVENGRSRLSEEKLRLILENRKGWNLDGLGEKSIADSGEKYSVPEPNTVPLLPIFAQAGSLVGWSEGIEEVKCERVISPVKDVDMAVHIYGESMYPDIPNGSVCYVRRVSGRIIDWGRAYILDTVDGPVLKYLTPGADDEHIRCQSANHDPRFAPFEVLKADILGMYRVVMCMKMM
jgi:transcriptional regulator with XRE-family HTH domain